MPPSPPSSQLDDIAPVLDALARRGHPVAAVDTMMGDVSRRRYFRLRLADGAGRDRAVLALYPDEMLDACRRYLEAGELLAGRGVRVAEVLDSDCGAGWVLLEDFGDRTLYEHAERPWDELERYFEAAVDAIGRILTLPAERIADFNPPLDRDLLCRELAQTRSCFFEPFFAEGAEGHQDTLTLWAALDALCGDLGRREAVPCHRDFGARNLMPLDDGRGGDGGVGVLDHQDLRLGPPAYDLASLLNDSLFPPVEVEERLLRRAGVPAEGAEREAYHRAAAQRTLKAVGNYAAFAGRGSDRHLCLIPPTLARALHHLGRLPETAQLEERLARAWKPALDGDGLERLLPSPRPGA